MSRDRSDLLAYLEDYRRAPALEVRRVERWRRRGASTGTIAGAARVVASRLARGGLEPGGHVGLHLNDGPLWIAGFFGVLRAGGVAIPLDPTLPPDLLRRMAGELELAFWIGEREVPDLALKTPRVDLDWTELRGRGSDHPPAGGAAADLDADIADLDADPDRIAEIVLTSGTSSAPKAVAIRHRNLRAVLDPLSAEIERHALLLRCVPSIRLAVSLPLAHLYGQVMGVFLPVHLRAHTVMISTLSGPELALVLREERVTVLATVPRTLALLGRYLASVGEKHWGKDGFAARLALAADRPWIRRWAMFAPLRRLLGWRMVGVISGGAAIDPEIEDLWRRLGYVVIQGYGLTEAAPLVTLNHPLHPVPGSLGKPLPGVEVRIAADGEIWVRGPNVAPSRPGETRVDAQGWLHTGDLGRRDAEGGVFYLGRKGERIVTPAGVNVDPEPLEALLRQEPGILETVILERPWGAPGVVCAVIAACPGTDVGKALRQVNRRFPDAARIRAWELWPDADFPRTRTGKPRRRVIAEWLATRAPAGAGSAAAGEGEGLPGSHASAAAAGDPLSALQRIVGELAGGGTASLGADTVLADALTSLDRVELATRLEMTYGLTLSDEAFAGHRTLGELARELGAVPARQVLTRQEQGDGEKDDADKDEERENDEEKERDEVTAGNSTAESVALTLSGRSIPVSPWRIWAAVRVARWVVREAAMRPLLALFVRIRVSGRDELSAIEPPFIIAANHLSFMDPAAILMSLPPDRRDLLAPAARWSFFTAGPCRALEFRAAVLGLNIIPLIQVGDWRPTLRIAGRLADRGYCPLIFPEGERSRDGGLGAFQLGVALMAQNLHLPIVPCAIAGLWSVLPRGARWPRRPAPIRRSPVEVRFGAPLPAPRPDDDLGTITEELRIRIGALHAQALHSVGRP